MRSMLLAALLSQASSVPVARTDLVMTGCCFDRVGDAEQRVNPRNYVVPGRPPTLSFRQYEGQKRQRFSHSELLLDDAGH
jgi:hypothetical protein